MSIRIKFLCPLIIFFSCILFYSGNCPAETLDAENIMIETFRVPVDRTSSTRNCSFITAEDIDSAFPSSLDSLFDSQSGTDIQTRGPQGIQSDVNVQGGNFEQSLVVVDGISVRDPQTGHFLLDVPVSLDDIEKIEILKGGGSSLYGANAMNGIIHIVTKKPEKSGCLVKGGYGEYGLRSAGFRLDEVKSAWVWTCSADYGESDGYRDDTDFLSRMINSSLAHTDESSDIKIFYGYLKKDFGAADFYSNLFPHEEEHTDTQLAYATGTFSVSPGLSLTARLYQRKHEDLFILDRNRPFFSHNEHTNYSTGAESFLSNRDADVLWSAGISAGRDEITSSSLGDHSRFRRGASGEINWMGFRETAFHADARVDDHEDTGAEPSASLGASRFFLERWKWRLSASRAYRIPSFTELYYRDPGNRGNSGLENEESTNYEGGIDFLSKDFTASAGVFYRQSDNLIDWARETKLQPWTAVNIRKADTRGIELSAKKLFHPDPDGPAADKISFSFTGLDVSSNDTGLLSKYVYQYLEQSYQARLDLICPFLVKQALFSTYRKRTEQSGYWLFSTVFSREFAWGKGKGNYFVSVENIFDQDYEDISAVDMPGRWVKTGFNILF